MAIAPARADQDLRDPLPNLVRANDLVGGAALRGFQSSVTVRGASLETTGFSGSAELPMPGGNKDRSL
jgi:hypothetical protein